MGMEDEEPNSDGWTTSCSHMHACIKYHTSVLYVYILLWYLYPIDLDLTAALHVVSRSARTVCNLMLNVYQEFYMQVHVYLYMIITTYAGCYMYSYFSDICGRD